MIYFLEVLCLSRTVESIMSWTDPLYERPLYFTQSCPATHALLAYLPILIHEHINSHGILFKGIITLSEWQISLDPYSQCTQASSHTDLSLLAIISVVPWIHFSTHYRLPLYSVNCLLQHRCSQAPIQRHRGGIVNCWTTGDKKK